jgi:hypothetical protein
MKSTIPKQAWYNRPLSLPFSTAQRKRREKYDG